MSIINKGLISKILRYHHQKPKTTPTPAAQFKKKKKKAEQKNRQGINWELAKKETWKTIYVHMGEREQHECTER